MCISTIGVVGVMHVGEDSGMGMDLGVGVYLGVGVEQGVWCWFGSVYT